MYGSSDDTRTMFKLDDMVTAAKKSFETILEIVDSPKGPNTSKFANVKLEATKALLTLEKMGK